MSDVGDHHAAAARFVDLMGHVGHDRIRRQVVVLACHRRLDLVLRDQHLWSSARAQPYAWALIDLLGRA